MENQMNAIISQLSNIENTAVRILESADRQKKELSLEMEKRKEEYDAEIAEDTRKQLDALKEELNAQKERELSRLREETSNALNELETDFEKNHTVWAKEILHSIIGE